MVSGVEVPTPPGVVVLVAALALVGLAVVAVLVHRSRRRADARLDDMASSVLHLAVALSEQADESGHEARLQMIRAAHAVMSEQASPRHRR